MSREAYEVGVKLAFAKHSALGEWFNPIRRIAKESPYLTAAATGGVLGAGVGGWVDGPEGALIGGVSGVGGSLLGRSAADWMQRKLLHDLSAQEPAIMAMIRKNEKYPVRAHALVHAGAGAAGTLGIAHALDSVAPKKDPLDSI